VSIIPVNPNQTVTVPAATDWLAVSKIIAIEMVFVASSAAVITGHSSADAVALAGATGLALGVLRVTDILANVVNVKSFLNNPASGVVPQAVGTPLVTVTQNGAPSNDRTPTP
jgi:hypothetical protein